MEDRHGRSGWAPATYLGPVVDRTKKTGKPVHNIIVGEPLLTVFKILCSFCIVSCQVTPLHL